MLAALIVQAVLNFRERASLIIRSESIDHSLDLESNCGGGALVRTGATGSHALCIAE